jgi:hypothetical protein
MKSEARSRKPEAGCHPPSPRLPPSLKLRRTRRRTGRPEAKRWAGRRLPISLTGISLQLSAFSLLILSGCATVPKSVPSPPPNLSPQAGPAAVPETKPPVPPPKPPPTPPSAASPPAVVSIPVPSKDEFVMSVDSEPSGAVIVVNGIPIGKAPLQLKVKTTLQGFFRDYMTVKARFLATSEDETSITVEEDCTPLERIPGEIIFMPEGAQRRQAGQTDSRN